MRVIQLIDSFGSGGGLERFVYNLSVELSSRGHDTVLATVDEDESDHQWGTQRFRQVCLGRDKNEWNDIIERLNPELIMWHGLPETAPIVLEVAGKYPTVATIHGAMCPSGSRLFRDSDDVCHRKGSLACLPNWYLKQCGFGHSPITAIRSIGKHKSMIRALSRCVRIYPVSTAIRDFLLIEGLDTEKIKVFDNTLGAIERIRTRGIQSINPSKPLHLLYVGRLVYPKGVQYLLHAVNHLISQGRETSCTIVGDGWYRRTLESLAEQLGIMKYIHFAGQLPGTEVPQIYADCDIVVVPSIWPDPAPLVVPEARERGKPVVVFDTGGLPEWATLMSGVYVAERASSRSLANVISDVATRYGEYHNAPVQGTGTELPHRVSLIDDCISTTKKNAWRYSISN